MSTPASVPDLRGLSFSGQVARGARYALAGVRLVALRPRLWIYLIVPMLITLALFFGGSLTLWQAIGWLFGLLWQPGPTTGAGWIWLWTAVVLFVKVAAVSTTALFLYFTAGLIATPFTDRLSEIIETSVLGPHEEPFTVRQLLGDLANSLLHSLLSLSLWLTVVVCTFALNLIPIAGSVASFLIGGVATAAFLARESMDGCMSRRRMTFRHKFRVVASRFPMMLGFGLVAAVLVWIPFLNFVVLPMAVAGGTLMYCHLEQQGLIPDARGQLGYAPRRTRKRALADHGMELDALGFSSGDPIKAEVPAAERLPVR